MSYKQNKPASAIANVEGTTPDSQHVFDVAKNLTSNYKVTGTPGKGGDSYFKHTETVGTQTTTVVNSTSTGSKGTTTYSGIYYAADGVRFNDTNSNDYTTAGDAEGKYKYPN